MAAPRGTAAQKAEATGEETREFTFDGVTYTVDADVTLDVLELIELRRNTLAMKEILGTAQWARFMSKRRTAKDLDELYGAYNQAGLGNS